MRGQFRCATGIVACALLLCDQSVWANRAEGPPSNDDLSRLTAAAISTDAGTASGAVAQLRAIGSDGLSALMSAYRDDINAHLANPQNPADPQRWERISAALDGVAKQRDAWACGLYWYTDLAAAEAAARASGKPILSLHLLGQLDQELSCANSRFFRVTLYPNRQVQDAMRNGFILHWKSERPVPVITIDFGDGRKIVRTITGNSIHYVLDASGRVIDAIPGLYAAQPFVQRLKEAATIELALRSCSSDSERKEQLRAWHRQQIAATDAACEHDLRSAKLAAVPAADDLLAWKQLGALHTQEMQVDATVKAVMAEKNPGALRAGRLAMSKMVVESPLVRAVRNIESMVAADCIRNEYVLHRQIHELLADGAANAGLDAFNDTVYSQLFLTPRSDPWLGLAPPDAYSALDHDGLIQAVAAK
jgi:hypothetical protein